MALRYWLPVVVDTVKKHLATVAVGLLVVPTGHLHIHLDLLAILGMGLKDRIKEKRK